MTDDDRRWLAAGRRLRRVEPGEYRRLLALAQAFASLHDDDLEDAAIFDARLAMLRGRAAQA